jgi:hypothetical protein
MSGVLTKLDGLDGITTVKDISQRFAKTQSGFISK